MSNIDFNTTIIRCSSIGKIMTEPKEKAAKERGDLSETAKTYLKQMYREARYNRRKEFSSKYTEKGLMVEEDAITLYSRLKKKFYKKNDKRLTNEFITGEPDLFDGPDIEHATEIVDTKSSWDLFTFPFPTDAPNKDYFWQAQGYMALTGATKATVAYCLINTPETLINDEKRRLFYKMNAGTDENPDYVAASEELERSMRFDDIPMQERMIEFKSERSDADIVRMYNQIRKARIFLLELHAGYGNTTRILGPKKTAEIAPVEKKKIQLLKI